jgi:hypothetical protein
MHSCSDVIKGLVPPDKDFLGTQRHLAKTKCSSKKLLSLNANRLLVYNHEINQAWADYSSSGIPRHKAAIQYYK